jgi:hypothetical protein
LVTISKESRQSWNGENFAQVKVYVKPEVAAAFKSKCLSDGVSMASRIGSLMAEDTGKRTLKNVPADAVLTRAQRRKAVKSIILLLDKILVMETHYMDSIPENLKNSIMHERAEEAIAALEGALDLLNEAY